MKKKEIFIGRQPALEILKSNQAVEKILIQKGVTGYEIEEIKAICKEQRIAIRTVPKEKIDYLLFPLYQHERPNHQGIVGYYGEIKYYGLDDVYNQILSKGETALFIIVDGITDVRNFGAIARTAEAMGAHAIITTEKGNAPINAETVKASAGAIHNIPICREKELSQVYNYLKLNGIQIAASSLKAEVKLHQIDFTYPTAIVMGSEGRGISKITKDNADHLFIIPMQGKINSLNVSVSAGMILYEASKQRT